MYAIFEPTRGKYVSLLLPGRARARASASLLEVLAHRLRAHANRLSAAALFARDAERLGPVPDLVVLVHAEAGAVLLPAVGLSSLVSAKWPRRGPALTAPPRFVARRKA